MLLTAAVALGVTAALLFLKDGAHRPLLNFAHGLTGATGLGVLVYALQGPRRGDAMGVGSFGAVAAVLFAIAAAIGIVLPWLHRRGTRAGGIALAAHATFAISGYLLYLAWNALGGDG